MINWQKTKLYLVITGRQARESILRRSFKPTFFLIRYILNKTFHMITSKLKLRGARIICDESGIVTVQLNSKTLLGKRGSTSYIPRDEAIFRHVCEFGYWSKYESTFLIRNINKVLQKDLDVAFIDFGAHAGLVSKQVQQGVIRPIDIYCVEPDSLHRSCLTRNLHGERIEISDFGLAATSGKGVLKVDPINRGGSSILNVAPHNTNYELEEIDLKSIVEWCEERKDKINNIFLKSDMEGMEGFVLPEIPDWFWKRTHAAVIEIFALPGFSRHDITKLIKIWEHEFKILK